MYSSFSLLSAAFAAVVLALEETQSLFQATKIPRSVQIDGSGQDTDVTMPGESLHRAEPVPEVQRLLASLLQAHEKASGANAEQSRRDIFHALGHGTGGDTVIDVRHLFKRLATDSSGSVSLDEFRAAIRELLKQLDVGASPPHIGPIPEAYRLKDGEVATANNAGKFERFGEGRITERIGPEGVSMAYMFGRAHGIAVVAANGSMKACGACEIDRSHCSGIQLGCIEMMQCCVESFTISYSTQETMFAIRKEDGCIVKQEKEQYDYSLATPQSWEEPQLSLPCGQVSRLSLYLDNSRLYAIDAAGFVVRSSHKMEIPSWEEPPTLPAGGATWEKTGLPCCVKDFHVERNWGVADVFAIDTNGDLLVASDPDSNEWSSRIPGPFTRIIPCAGFRVVVTLDENGGVHIWNPQMPINSANEKILLPSGAVDAAFDSYDKTLYIAAVDGQIWRTKIRWH